MRPDCLWHGPGEPDEGYRFCGECWHMYASWKELVQEYIDAHGCPPEDQIWSCPMCLHDF